jgi:[glutamine synthetase] adenylyltransferase / [glutamine synthetase]-adenylyl-L-tyrosine phosphorylase
MNQIERLIENLPNPDSSRRFVNDLSEIQRNKLSKNLGLFSDILTISSVSPLLATTILQNPSYIAWISSKRNDIRMPGKDELLESLGRFSLTNSQFEASDLFANFRRRELLRIYLKDIRGLCTISEITEDLSNVADAILENAVNIAIQELNNRYGKPLETDEKGRTKNAEFCIVALGKLGSNELNYASDIDLLFVYSANGETSGGGSRGSVSNHEYFVKLAELILKMVGKAYRIDMRLRPNGQVGSLAISLKDAIRYYKNDAQAWEKQVLIRSRSSAGDAEIFKFFHTELENVVFSADANLEQSLRNVRLSKDKINEEKLAENGFDVKLGRGGIREIEFIAQALQLALGGKDAWLRVPHTLRSLSRLADRKFISDAELTQLFEAYEFLRKLEHRLQMENGLQTHFLTNEVEKRSLIAKYMLCTDLNLFDALVESHTTNVAAIFTRIFAEINFDNNEAHHFIQNDAFEIGELSLSDSHTNLLNSIEKSNVEIDDELLETLDLLSDVSPYFSELITSNPDLISKLPSRLANFDEVSYLQRLAEAILNEKTYADELAALRKTWSGFIIQIAVFDIFGKFDRSETKRLQTNLAEASIEIAIQITERELQRRFPFRLEDFSFAVLGLGKLGGKGMDYGSDLDLVLVYDDAKASPVPDLTHIEFYSRAVEVFVTVLSSITRDGHLYRVDLRLRPDGKNGVTISSKSSFINYLEHRAAIWELLAYVKLRAISGDIQLAKFVEKTAREVIHSSAQKVKTDDLQSETKSIRKKLESKQSSKIDIKFGDGGMLDVYFAMRFLQLRDNIPDDSENRSTPFMLKKLFDCGSLDKLSFTEFSEGYEFLASIDHALRLTVGRSNSLSNSSLPLIAKVLGATNSNSIIEELTHHRINIRSAFERILN